MEQGQFLNANITFKEIQLIKKVLKKKLACGGAIKEEWFEFQGDVKAKIIDVLTKEGWKFK